MGQSIRKRISKINRKNHTNKVKYKKMIEQNIIVLNSIKESIKK